MYPSSYAVGQVWHTRLTPLTHHFTYQLNCWVIDLQQLDQLPQVKPWLVNNGWGLYSFNPNRYLRHRSPANLITKVKDEIIELGGKLDGDEQFNFVGQLTNCGLYFSPLNLFLCWQGDSCRYILAEVSNTPWNQRHYYLLDLTQQPLVISKKFHVSPFWPTNQDYHWQFTFEANRLLIKIENHQAGQRVFSAGYNLQLHPLNKISLRRQLLAQPFNSLKIVGAIYYQALRLWLKKVPFYGHPDSKKKRS